MAPFSGICLEDFQGTCCVVAARGDGLGRSRSTEYGVLKEEPPQDELAIYCTGEYGTAQYSITFCVHRNINLVQT